MCLQYDERAQQQLDITPMSVRGGWETCRFYLLLASQLSIHREQLHAIITAHEDNLGRHGYGGSEMRKAERGGLRRCC